MRPQAILLIWPVSNQKVHDRFAFGVIPFEHLGVVWNNELSEEMQPLWLKAYLPHMISTVGTFS